VVQSNLVYAVGLPLDVCHEDILKEADYFGQFGRTLKVSVNRSNQYASALARHGPTGSAYVTFRRAEDALRCIKTLDGTLWKGKPIKACFGTTKYCNAFLKGVPCTNPDCLYLHEPADEADCLTKEEVAAGLLPARFLAMGAHNTFKPRLTINVIPNAATTAAQAAAQAAVAAGGTPLQVAAAAAAAGGVNRQATQGSQQQQQQQQQVGGVAAAQAAAPRVLTIPASLLRGGQGRGQQQSQQQPILQQQLSQQQQQHADDAPGSSTWGPPGHASPLATAASFSPPKWPARPVPPPINDTAWPSLGGGGGDPPLSREHSLSDAREGAGEGPGMGRVGSTGITMAEQLARSHSTGGSVSRQGSGKTLLPLSSPGKQLKSLGKAVMPRAPSPPPPPPLQTVEAAPLQLANGHATQPSVAGMMDSLSLGNGLEQQQQQQESMLEGLGESMSALTPAMDLLVSRPPQLGSRGPPPGFNAPAVLALQQQRPRTTVPPPGFGAPPAPSAAPSTSWDSAPARFCRFVERQQRAGRPCRPAVGRWFGSPAPSAIAVPLRLRPVGGRSTLGGATATRSATAPAAGAAARRGGVFPVAVPLCQRERDRVCVYRSAVGVAGGGAGSAELQPRGGNVPPSGRARGGGIPSGAGAAEAVARAGRRAARCRGGIDGTPPGI
jgi:hypothetical protein